MLPGLPAFPPLEASVVLALAAILTAVQGVIASITIILAAVYVHATVEFVWFVDISLFKQSGRCTKPSRDPGYTLKRS